MGARLLIYDATRPPGEFWLRTAWATGARVYKSLGRIDAYFGAHDWKSALAWVNAYEPSEPIDEIQYWGHGKWGKVYIAGSVLSEASLLRESDLAPELAALTKRMHEGSLLWFRTCETFGADPGKRFAENLTNFLGCRAAGHTYVIHALQSGLHGLRAGERATWSGEEGLAKGTSHAPLLAYNSVPSAPNTLHFMNGEVPAAFFAGSEAP